MRVVVTSLALLLLLSACADSERSSGPLGPDGIDTGWEWIDPLPTGAPFVAATSGSDGLAHFATVYGEVFAFDGSRFATVGHLPGRIHDLEVDPAGTLWAVTEDALWRREGEAWRPLDDFTGGTVDGSDNQFVWLAFDEVGGAVVSTFFPRDLYRFDGATWTHDTSLRETFVETITGLAVAPDGAEIAVSDSGGDVYVSTADGWDRHDVSDFEGVPPRIGFDSAGDLVAFQIDAVHHRRDGTWTSVPMPDGDDAPNDGIVDLTALDDGWLFITDTSGAWFYDGETVTTWRRPIPFADESQTPEVWPLHAVTAFDGAGYAVGANGVVARFTPNGRRDVTAVRETSPVARIGWVVADGAGFLADLGGRLHRLGDGGPRFLGRPEPCGRLLLGLADGAVYRTSSLFEPCFPTPEEIPENVTRFAIERFDDGLWTRTLTADLPATNATLHEIIVWSDDVAFVDYWDETPGKRTFARVTPSGTEAIPWPSDDLRPVDYAVADGDLRVHAHEIPHSAVLLRLENDTFVEYARHEFEYGPLTGLLDRSGRLWTSGSPAPAKVIDADGVRELPFDHVRSFAELSDGSIVARLDDGTLARHRDGVWDEDWFGLPFPERVAHLEFDGSGRLVVVTDTGGIVRTARAVN